METLQAIYIALAIFGVGVTVVDLFGALDHGSGQTHDSGHDGHDGHADGHDGGHDAGHDGGHDTAHEAHGGHDEDRGAVLGSREASLPAADSRGFAGSTQVARLVSMLRLIVWFSLGAGPTGLVALAMRLGTQASLLWALGAGVAIAALAKGLRSLARRDLDSSFRAEDFILEEAEVTVPVAPGLMGKAVVRKYGALSEVFIKATSEAAAYARGAKVRIIDYQEDCYLVEAADEEHLVH
jgi:hypothetical protein